MVRSAKQYPTSSTIFSLRFSVAVIKHHDQSNLRKTVYLGLWLEGDKGPSWQGIVLSSARHGCRNKKLTFQPLAWSRESNWKWSGEFRLRKTVSSDILLPIKPGLQNIPQMVLLTGDQAFKSCEGHFHLKPHHLSIHPTLSLLAQSLVWYDVNN